MFAHGYGCDQNMWRHVAPRFEDRYRVVLFDYVGSGGARAPYDPDRYSTLEGYAEDMLSFQNATARDDIALVALQVPRSDR